MKRFLISMAALLAVVGCAKQDDLVSGGFGSANGPEFEVGFEASRVAIAEDGEGFKLTWSEGDLVSCFLSTGGNAKYIYAGEPGEVFGIIKPLEGPAGEPLDAYYAAYPYTEENALVDGKLSITLPAEQTYAVGTFGPNSNTMVAVNAEKEPFYTFSNMCGYVRLKVWGEAAITSIEFQGNKEEVIAGAALADATAKSLEITGEGKTITLNCNEGVALGASEAEATEFWVVVPPMTFDEGFTVTLTDAEGKVMTKKLGTAFTVERNAVHEGKIEFKNDNIIFDAKFNADGTVTDAGKFGLNVQTMKRDDVEADYLQVYENNNTYISRSLWQPSDQGNENYAIQKTGYYMVDFSENAEFKAALEDGFSAETVFMIPLSNINRCTVFGTNAWSISKGHNSDKMWASYNVNIASYPYSNFGTVAESGIVSINEFHHAMFVYDAETDKVALYIDGQLAKENTDVATFDIGARLCIGARPMMCTDDNYASAIHHWCGDIASAKIYNKALTAAEVEQCYNKATIPAYKEVLPQAFFDAKFNMDGSIENQGTSQNIDIKQIVPVAGQTPAVEVIDGAQFGSTNNIINFTQLPSNPGTYAWDAWLTSSQGRPEGAVYYTVGIGDAAGNADFLAKLNSGYITIEFIAAVGTDLEYTTNGIDKYCPFSMEYFNFNYWVTASKKCQEVNALVPGETDIMTDMPSWTNVNEFHHFIWAANVKEGMSARVLDGVMRFNKDRYDLSQKQTSGLWIGAAYWNASTITRPFNGKIVAIRVYDRALGTAEMGALVKNAKPIIDKLNAHYSAN